MHATHFLVSFIRLFTPEILTLTRLCIFPGLQVTLPSPCRGDSPVAVKPWCAQLPAHSPCMGTLPLQTLSSQCPTLLDVWFGRTQTTVALHGPTIECNRAALGGWVLEDAGWWHSPLSHWPGGGHRALPCSDGLSGLRGRLWSHLPSCTIHSTTLKPSIFPPRLSTK